MSAPDEATGRRLVVDRFEGDLAVVEVEGGPVLDLPRWLLPPGAREGDVVVAQATSEDEAERRVVLRLDREATRLARDSAADRLKRLQARDPGGDIQL